MKIDAFVWQSHIGYRKSKTLNDLPLFTQNISILWQFSLSNPGLLLCLFFFFLFTEQWQTLQRAWIKGVELMTAYLWQRPQPDCRISIILWLVSRSLIDAQWKLRDKMPNSSLFSTDKTTTSRCSLSSDLVPQRGMMAALCVCQTLEHKGDDVCAFIPAPVTQNIYKQVAAAHWQDNFYHLYLLSTDPPTPRHSRHVQLQK